MSKADDSEKQEMARMKDALKSKARLIDELTQLRKRIAQLESKLKNPESGNEDPAEKNPSRRENRRDLRANIEFITDFDIVEARGINISEGGISFELYEELPFELRFDLEGRLHHYRANLVWVKRIPEGGFRFGLMFVKNPSSEILF
ncbi:MAG: PilZ domain-containing protein [Desulfococcaceae bacterium]|jgi:hypothetical protein|nr:PilZ domain-containing protein [Desulfococcaceae bacterium]